MVLMPEQRRQIIFKRILSRMYEVMGKNGMNSILGIVEKNIKKELNEIKPDAVGFFFNDESEKPHNLTVDEIFKDGELKLDEKGQRRGELTDFIAGKEYLQKLIINEGLRDRVFQAPIESNVRNIGYSQGIKLKASTVEQIKENIDTLFRKNEVEYNISETDGSLNITLDKCPWDGTNLCAYTEGLLKGIVGSGCSVSIKKSIYNGADKCEIYLTPKKS